MEVNISTFWYYFDISNISALRSVQWSHLVPTSQHVVDFMIVVCETWLPWLLHTVMRSTTNHHGVGYSFFFVSVCAVCVCGCTVSYLLVCPRSFVRDSLSDFLFTDCLMFNVLRCVSECCVCRCFWVSGCLFVPVCMGRSLSEMLLTWVNGIIWSHAKKIHSFG